MSSLNLKMGVQYKPQSDEMVARIEASDGDNGIYIALAADFDGTFKHQDVSAMLRLFADQIEHKFGETKEAA